MNKNSVFYYLIYIFYAVRVYESCCSLNDLRDSIVCLVVVVVVDAATVAIAVACFDPDIESIGSAHNL